MAHLHPLPNQAQGGPPVLRRREPYKEGQPQRGGRSQTLKVPPEWQQCGGRQAGWGSQGAGAHETSQREVGGGLVAESVGQAAGNCAEGVRVTRSVHPESHLHHIRIDTNEYVRIREYDIYSHIRGYEYSYL